MAIKLLCISTADAGRMLSVSRTTIWRHTQQGLLQGVAAGNRTLIPLYEVAHKRGITFAEAMQIIQEHRIEMCFVWLERVTAL